MQSTRSAKGQTIIIMAMAALVLFGLVALAIDGGSALLQRRNMQNGADASALAAIELMQGNGVAISCVDGSGNPTDCHPTHLTESRDVIAQAAKFVAANQGGVIGVGATDAPSAAVGYHLQPGGPGCPKATNPKGCYIPAANDTSLVPDWVDGVVVTATIQNPTTFARAVNISTIPVSAIAAARVNATCATPAAPGPTLPFTRFRPVLEDEMLTHGNDLNHTYQFWTSQPDLGASWKDTLSLSQRSLYDPKIVPAPPKPLQFLTLADLRNGLPSQGGVGPNYGGTGCTDIPLNSTNCADMRGTEALSTDGPNWIYWAWNGKISITQTWAAGSVGGTRQGDWAETYKPGDLGTNLAGPIIGAIARNGYTTTLTGPPYNYGKALDKTVYVWGVSRAEFLANGSGGDLGKDALSAQMWVPHTNNKLGFFQDVTVVLKNNGHYDTLNNDPVDRVRFTWSYNFRFYSALQINNSAVYGLLISQVQPGPQPGNCGLLPGGAIYSGLTDPP